MYTFDQYPEFLKNDLQKLERVSLEDLQLIYKTVLEIVGTTPVIDFKLSEQTPLKRFSIKLENRAPTGSFKIRGASYCLKQIKSRFKENSPHIFAASTGNHGIAMAYVAAQFNIPITVVVPESISQHKKSEMLKYNAIVIEKSGVLDDALVEAKMQADKERGIFIDSSHYLLSLGHSSMFYELFNQSSDIKHLFFPIGVGAGIAAAILVRNLMHPKLKIIGVVPEQSPSWHASKLSGLPISVAPKATIATGLCTALPDRQIFDYLNRYLDDMIMVSEDEIKEAMRISTKFLEAGSEGTGVVGLAGVLNYSKQSKDLKDNQVVTVIGG